GGGRLGQRRIGWTLSRDGTVAHVPELPTDADALDQVRRRDGLIDECGRRLPGARAGDRYGDLGGEPCHRGVRGPVVGSGDGGRAAGVQVVADTVEDDHLPVELVERTQAEVAVPQQLGDGRVAVVDAAEQGGNGRRLIDRLRVHVAYSNGSF